MASKNRPQPGVVKSAAKTADVKLPDTKASQGKAAEIVALEKALHQQPYKYGYYQVLRRFECLYPQQPKIGTSLRPLNVHCDLCKSPS